MDVLLYAMYFIVFYVVYVFFTMYFVRNDKINLWNQINQITNTVFSTYMNEVDGSPLIHFE